jgi:hypothetical protein
MKRFFIDSFFIFALIITILSGTSQADVTQPADNVLVIRVDAPIPALDTLVTPEGSFIRISPQDPDWVAGPLPYKVHTHSLQGKVTAELVSIRSHRVPSPPPLISSPEDSLGEAKEHYSDSHPIWSIHSPFTLKGPDIWQGISLWTLLTFPYQYDRQSQELVVHTELVVRLTFAGANTKGSQLSKETASVLQAMGVRLVHKNLTPSTRTVNSLPKILQTGPRYKLHVVQDGIYRVTGKDLQQAGVSLFDVDIKSLSLTAAGEPVPLYVSGWRDGQFDENDYIEFWGIGRRQTYQDRSPDLYQDPYGDVRIYWLSWGDKPGLWMGEEQGGVTGGGFNIRRPYSFYEKVHVERDNFFDRIHTLPPDSMRDHWFMDSGVSAASKKDYEFMAYHPDVRSPLPVKVRVMMGGRTDSYEKAHDVSVFVNDRYVTDASWFAQALKEITNDSDILTGADLKNGENVLSVINNVDRLVPDFVMVNWFEIDYPRLYRAYENYIKFSVPPDYELGEFLFRIDGFTNERIDIYKLGSSKILGATIEQITDFTGFTSLQLSFQDRVSSRSTEYVAVARDQKLVPIKIERDETTSLASTMQRADYLVVSHGDFIESEGLKNLIDLRQSQGYAVLKVDIADVFDEFGHGMPSPYALKSFLSYAYVHWAAPKLKYVLLVGDGCYDRYGAEGDTLDFIPVKLRQTVKHGAAASDFWYTLLEGDDEIPDIALGRLPVRTLEECDAITQKIVMYENDPPSGAWRNHFLFIGGNGNVFRDQGLDLIQRTPYRFETSALFTLRDDRVDFDPYFGGTTDLLEYFDQGCAVINFHGHGGGGIWADKGLLRVEDVERIFSQGKYPFIMSMTCFTGAFESPTITSLADALLFSAEKGTNAFLGASGQTYVLNDYYMQREILDVLYKNPDMPIGDVVNFGKLFYKIRYPFSYLVFTEMNQYHLLGDPAMRLSLPTTMVDVITDKSIVQQGETVTARVDLPFDQGEGRFDLVDDDRNIITRQDITINSNQVFATLPLDDQTNGERAAIRFYANDALGLFRVHGQSELSLTPVHFDSLSHSVMPGTDSLTFSLSLQSNRVIQTVTATVQTVEFPLERIRPGQWQSASVYLPYPGQELQAIFTAVDSEGNAFKSPVYRFRTGRGYNLTTDPNTFHFGGSHQTELSTMVFNDSDHDISEIPVFFDRYDSTSQGWQEIAALQIDLLAGERKPARIAYALPPGLEYIRVRVDPDSLYDQNYRWDNQYTKRFYVEQYTVDPVQGFNVGKAWVSTIKVYNELTVSLSSNGILRETVLTLDRLPRAHILEQPGFKYWAGLPVYRIEPSGDFMAEPANPVDLAFFVQDRLWRQADSLGFPLSVYRLDPETQKWVRQNPIREGNVLRQSAGKWGLYAVLAGRDSQLPKIEITIDGQPFVENSYVSKEPFINIVLHDENGIDQSEEGLYLALDSNPLTEVMPDTILDANRLQIEFRPQMQPGFHSLRVWATDCYGNRSQEVDLAMNVAEDFQVKVLGNYPNPFDEETIFAYVLTLPCDEWSLKIYTASGQLIRVLKPEDNLVDSNPMSADYHEIIWDGTDDQGFQVANGVYFYRMTAKSKDVTRKVTGKIARVQ